MKNSRRKIGFVATGAGDWGGASRSLYELIKELDRSKFEPVIFFPDDGPIINTIEEMGIKYYIHPVHEYTNPLSYFRSIIKAIRLYKKSGIELLHINFGSFWRLAEVDAARLIGLPVFAHLRLLNKHLSPSMKRCTLAIANSQFTADNSSLGKVPVEVMHNIVDLKRYDKAHSIRQELALNAHHIVVTFIGQVRKNKGVDTFIQAAKAVVGENVKFLIVGECRDKTVHPDSYTQESLLSDIAQDERIQYVGYRSDIQNVYFSSDIIVMPSLWDEPFGLVNIEAGAMKKPIISSAVGGIPEIVEDGVNGFLFERGDAKQLSKSIQQLVNDKGLRLEMGIKGRSVVETRFTTAPVRHLEEIYSRVVG